MVEVENNNQFIHNFSSNKNLTKVLAPVLVVVIVTAGILTGYFLSQKHGVSNPASLLSGGGSKEEVGSSNSEVFSDTAVGVIEAGGLDGEGTHKLIREGGPSQTAYLTSSVIDLDQFVGKKVEIKGKTYAGKKAAWLMDVGKVKLLE